jgi:hypothetical protein
LFGKPDAIAPFAIAQAENLAAGRDAMGLITKKIVRFGSEEELILVVAAIPAVNHYSPSPVRTIAMGNMKPAMKSYSYLFTTCIDMALS